MYYVFIYLRMYYYNRILRFTLNLDLVWNEDKMSYIRKYLRIPIVTFIEID